MMPNFRKQRIAGRIVKLSLTLLILAVNAIVIWRVFFSANIPKEISALAPNEALCEAYAEHGDGLLLRYQEQKSLTYAEHNAGYFGVPEYVFIPEAEQVQLIFRYNDSTLRHLQEDFELTEAPEKALEWFDVTLVKTVDLTPENEEDNRDPATLQVERFMPSRTVRVETSLYTYYRLVFDGVVVDELTDGVFLDVYYNGAVDYEQTPYGTLCLYDAKSPWIDTKLSAQDRRALQDAD